MKLLISESNLVGMMRRKMITKGNRRKEFRLYSGQNIVKPIEASVPDLGRKPLMEVRHFTISRRHFPRVPSVVYATPHGRHQILHVICS